MADDSSISVFTGTELALADTVLLLMKVMSMHGIIDSAAILTVFADLEQRYRRENLHAAAAMADYLRQHAGNAVGSRRPMVRRDLDCPYPGRYSVRAFRSANR